VTLTEDSPAPGSVAATQPTIKHQPALDGLRGLAVAGVLLFHGGHLTGGYLGVDAFFVLSGFLITTLLLVEHGNRGRISLGHFWARRARRLLPALVCVLAAVALYAAFIAQRGELPTVRWDAISTLFYFANWHAIVSTGDYFAIFRSPSPLQHTWSLAIEEQFYLVWPLVLVAVLRRGMPAKAAAKRVLALTVVLAASSFVLAQLLYTKADPSRVYYGTDTRAAAILCGAALACALAAWGPVRGTRARRALEVVALIAAALLAVAWTHLSGNSNFLYRGGLLLCGLAVTIVIASAVHPERGPISTALSFKPLCALGIISYGVYLWHWPIFVWCNEQRTGLSGWPLFALQLAITFAVAIASYRIIERPIRYGWGTPRVMVWAVPATVVALVAGLFAATTASSLPVIAAWVPGQHTVPRASDASWIQAMDYLHTVAERPSNAARVLVYGDSIALTLSTEYAGGVYHGRRIEGTSLGLIGCSLLPWNRVAGSVTYQQDPRCNDWPSLLGSAIAAYHPAVVATMFGAWEMFDRETGTGRENAGTQQLGDQLSAQLERLRKIVVDGGARLAILDTPCYKPPPGQDGQANIWKDTSRTNWLNGVWAQFAARHPGDTSIAGLDTELCPGGRPIEDRYGDKYRQDGMHFTPEGTNLVWHWIDDHLALPVETTASPKRAVTSTTHG
jgi:peptidoglycan/LPS O-acetylase OafA/YrhL